MKRKNSVILSVLGILILTSCVSRENTFVPIPLGYTYKMEYLNVVNRARSHSRTCGSKGFFKATEPLSWNDKLYNAAYEHSYDMATSNTFSHQGSGEVSDGVGRSEGGESSVKERIEAYGYNNWQIYAENIGAGTNIDTADKLVNKLLQSDGHCANIMNPLLSELGMAMVKNPNGKYTYYWTQDFGSLLNK